MFNETTTKNEAIAYVQNFANMQRAKIALRETNTKREEKADRLEIIMQTLASYDITMPQRQDLEIEIMNVAMELQELVQLSHDQNEILVNYVRNAERMAKDILL